MALLAAILDGNRFLGIEWDEWKIIGWLGNALFASRFFVQWVVTEKRKQVIIPLSFWWLSLAGSLMLLVYGIHRRDSVFIFAYAFTWIPYIRNIVIHYRNKAAQRHCDSCGMKSVQDAVFCHKCGIKLSL
jgi:lipid-A-disaccharide synthase-like uncharacterized protein